MQGKVLQTKRGFTNKRCPKCGGNVYIDLDLHNWFEKCLQCGHISYLPDLLKSGAVEMKNTASHSNEYAVAHN